MYIYTFIYFPFIFSHKKAENNFTSDMHYVFTEDGDRKFGDSYPCMSLSLSFSLYVCLCGRGGVRMYLHVERHMLHSTHTHTLTRTHADTHTD